MTVKAAGYHVLVELEAVEETSKGGILIHSKESQEREQRGHHMGRVIHLGPLCFAGYSGIDSELDATGRAAQWGVKVGDLVEFGRYAGEMVQKEGVDRYMIIPDQKLLGVFDE
jgi:co-chaperonin GroES (HSP10)